jgi:hypothetical protein
MLIEVVRAISGEAFLFGHVVSRPRVLASFLGIGTGEALHDVPIQTGNDTGLVSGVRVFIFRNACLQSIFCSEEAENAKCNYWRNSVAAYSTDAARFQTEAAVHKHTIVSRNEHLSKQD